MCDRWLKKFDLFLKWDVLTGMLRTAGRTQEPLFTSKRKGTSNAIDTNRMTTAHGHRIQHKVHTNGTFQTSFQISVVIHSLSCDIRL